MEPQKIEAAPESKATKVKKTVKNLINAAKPHAKYASLLVRHLQ